MAKLKGISLYSGAGGMDVGFEQAGVDVIAANDSWDVAMQTYALNRPDGGTEICAGPLAEHRSRLVQLAEQEHVDVVFGGPPCQDFSTVGWRGRDERDNLRAAQTSAFIDTAAEIGPEFIVMENVNTILSTGRLYFDAIRRCLDKAGYAVITQVLNAVDLGAPQFRKRCFIMAHKQTGLTEADMRVATRQGRHVSVKDYMPDIDRGQNRTDFYFHPKPCSGDTPSVFRTDVPAPTIHGNTRPIPSTYAPVPRDATSDMSLVRPLTIAERAGIQTFPPGYRFAGCRTAQSRQIGNAVPPLMARAVAEAVLRS